MEAGFEQESISLPASPASSPLSGSLILKKTTSSSVPSSPATTPRRSSPIVEKGKAKGKSPSSNGWWAIAPYSGLATITPSTGGPPPSTTSIPSPSTSSGSALAGRRSSLGWAHGWALHTATTLPPGVGLLLHLSLAPCATSTTSSTTSSVSFATIDGEGGDSPSQQRLVEGQSQDSLVRFQSQGDSRNTRFLIFGGSESTRVNATGKHLSNDLYLLQVPGIVPHSLFSFSILSLNY